MRILLCVYDKKSKIVKYKKIRTNCFISSSSNFICVNQEKRRKIIEKFIKKYKFDMRDIFVSIYNLDYELSIQRIMDDFEEIAT